MKLLIASNNKHKVAEIKKILSGKFDEIYSLAECGIDADPKETASDFLGNARIKAREIARHTDLAVVADDSGLEVEALDGAPGVYSARYAGEPCSDERNNDKLLREMATITDRRARFVTCMVLRFPSGREMVGVGEVKGEILTERKGRNGFGYDPLFYSYELGKSFGEATDDEKNAVSHRARALSDLMRQL